jgi:hypothetical protein
MSTRSDIKRSGEIIKVDIHHTGTQEIRQNLRNSLLGRYGEESHHIVEMRELACTINHPSLTTHNQKGEPQILFRILGKHGDTQVRNNDEKKTVNIDGLYLGDRKHAVAKTTNNGIKNVPEDEFNYYVPAAQSVQDFVWRLQRKLNRVSQVLAATGWSDILTTDGDEGHDGDEPGGFGTAEYPANLPVIIPYEDDRDVNNDFIELHLTCGGYLEFRGNKLFWDSFVVWCSPLFREMTGYPELLGFDDDDFGEKKFVDVTGDFYETYNAKSPLGILAKKTLFATFEQRRDILVTSDIPIPVERYVKDDQDTQRFILGFFDIRGHHETETTRDVRNLTFESAWSITGTNIMGRQICDQPGQVGFYSLVLPSNIPSFNVRVLLRRNRWDFDKNVYVEEEVSLLQNSTDWIVLRLVFTPQE